MIALRNHDLPEALRAEMARLSRSGCNLLPLGGGSDGKSPLLSGWQSSEIPLPRVLAPMHRAGSQVYGIRLHRFAVIDCDENNPALVRDIEARFGETPVKVQTPRGLHLYYRTPPGQLPNLRSESLPVDIKAGPNSYVVGPRSLRPDGGLYRPVSGALGQDALPVMRLASKAGQIIAKGNRHDVLKGQAIRMVQFVDSPDELAANLKGLRDDLCEDAGSLPDAEVISLANWAWRCRLENRVYAGRNSAFRVQRTALDLIRGNPDALALYVILADQHGHIAGKPFGLHHQGMKDAGLITLSRERFNAARDYLINAGLLQMVQTHIAGKRSQAFCLMMPADATVARLPPARKQGGKA